MRAFLFMTLVSLSSFLNPIANSADAATVQGPNLFKLQSDFQNNFNSGWKVGEEVFFKQSDNTVYDGVILGSGITPNGLQVVYIQGVEAKSATFGQIDNRSQKLYEVSPPQIGFNRKSESRPVYVLDGRRFVLTYFPTGEILLFTGTVPNVDHFIDAEVIKYYNEPTASTAKKGDMVYLNNMFLGVALGFNTMTNQVAVTTANPKDFGTKFEMVVYNQVGIKFVKPSCEDIILSHVATPKKVSNL